MKVCQALTRNAKSSQNQRVEPSLLLSSALTASSRTKPTERRPQASGSRQAARPERERVKAGRGKKTTEEKGEAGAEV